MNTYLISVPVIVSASCAVDAENEEQALALCLITADATEEYPHSTTILNGDYEWEMTKEEMFLFPSLSFEVSNVSDVSIEKTNDD